MSFQGFRGSHSRDTEFIQITVDQQKLTAPLYQWLLIEEIYIQVIAILWC